MGERWFDDIPAGVVFAGTALLLILASEAGFRMGRRGGARGQVDERRAHAGVLLGALLGLLGLMLAFSFNIAEGRFQLRKQLVLREANALGTAFLRAGLLPAPHDEEVRRLLRAYVEPRAEVAQSSDLVELLEESEAIQLDLWRQAEAVAASDRSAATALFISALNEVIDLHEERLTAAFYNRLPAAIFLSLFLIAALAAGVLGYTPGLSGTRALLPTAAVLVAIAVVMVLIIDLDRPWQRVFHVGQQALIDVRETMSRAG